MISFLRISLLFPLPAFLLSGCFTDKPSQNYYASPFNGNHSPYQPLPLRSDSAHNALYVHGGYTGGRANQQQRDAFTSYQLSLTATHHVGKIQLYYGLDLAVGTYKVGRWDTGYVFFRDLRIIPPTAAASLNRLAGSRSFGGAGFHGGLNMVMPTHRGEWRYLGVETSMRQEFGNYLSFRQHLPDSLATLNIRRSFIATAGLSSEIIKRTNQGEFGFRIALGWVLGKDYASPGVYDYVSAGYLHYVYQNVSFHYTWSRYTGYLQGDLATQANSVQTGIQYRFGSPRNAARPKRSRREIMP